MTRASSVVLYLGVGLAVQVIGYDDTPLHTLISTDANLSLWAHILAWPLFLLFLCGYYMLWLFGVLTGIGICVVVGLAINDVWKSRQRAKLRHMRGKS